jgi:hypothetical protein
MLPEVGEADPGRLVIRKHGRGGLGDQDLPAVSGGHDPSRPVHAKPEILALVGDGGLARVHPDADPDPRAFWPAVVGELTLGCGGAFGSVAGPGEDVEGSVSLRIDFLAAVGGERLAKDPLMFGEDLAVAVSELLE